MPATGPYTVAASLTGVTGGGSAGLSATRAGRACSATIAGYDSSVWASWTGGLVLGDGSRANNIPSAATHWTDRWHWGRLEIPN